MIGIDTNIMIRLITHDDPEQTKQAITFVSKHCRPDSPGFITLITVAEIAWLLEKSYKYPRDKVLQTFQSIAKTKHFLIERFDLFETVLYQFELGKANFNDYLIAYCALECGVDYVATFDKKASKSPLYKLVS